MQRFLFALCALIIHLSCLYSGEQALTYTFSGNKSRFGDHLMTYMRAKWLSYHYEIPLLYRPFPYSDQLVLHQLESKYPHQLRPKPVRTITLGHGELPHKNLPGFTLYISPYFPESEYERNQSHFSWPYFEVNWRDAGFRQLLKRFVAPLSPVSAFAFPEGRVSIALHMRKGGGFDSKDVIKAMPLKFPPESFYVEQLKKLYAYLEERPCYVYIFTDDQNPQSIAERLQPQLEGLDLLFGFREEGNSHRTHVLEDFFTMTQFECLIRPDSNFSIAASKIGDYRVVISPKHFSLKDQQVCIDEINLEITK